MTQVAVGNQIWNYTEVGEGEKTPMLILHGWGRHGNEWREVAKELAVWSGRKVYVLDLPGFGGSSLPKVRDIQEYTGLVVKFCEYMGIKQTIVLGHSLGARVAIVMGAKHKEMIERLILVDPAGVKPRSVRRLGLKMIAKLFAWIPIAWRRGIWGKLMDEDYRNSPALRDLYRVIVAHDLRRYLSEIQCATTLVWGERDPILPLSLSKIYRQYLKEIKLRVVWGAGHDPHLTHYEQTLSILQEATE